MPNELEGLAAPKFLLANSLGEVLAEGCPAQPAGKQASSASRCREHSPALLQFSLDFFASCPKVSGAAGGC